jgi:hypothetical protein
MRFLRAARGIPRRKFSRHRKLERVRANVLRPACGQTFSDHRDYPRSVARRLF